MSSAQVPKRIYDDFTVETCRCSLIDTVHKFD